MLDEFVIIPNHIHGIIKIVGTDPGVNDNQIVGADLCVCPDNRDKQPEPGEHTGSPLPGSSLHRMVQWFKTMATNDYIRGINDHGWDRFNGKLWQRNYYEHIIRDDRELHATQEYIRYNPLKWDDDEENPDMKGCRGNS